RRDNEYLGIDHAKPSDRSKNTGLRPTRRSSTPPSISTYRLPSQTSMRRTLLSATNPTTPSSPTVLHHFATQLPFAPSHFITLSRPDFRPAFRTNPAHIPRQIISAAAMARRRAAAVA